MNIITYNSKHDIYGNRRNLVVNYDTEELYFNGGNVFNKGEVVDGLGIRYVNSLYKAFKRDGFKEVEHKVARNW